MTRKGFPIESLAVKNPVRTGIVFGNLSFPLWEAAVAAGATLEELRRLHRGLYRKDFVVSLLAWHEMHQTVALHIEDARAAAAERLSKRKSK